MVVTDRVLGNVTSICLVILSLGAPVKGFDVVALYNSVQMSHRSCVQDGGGSRVSQLIEVGR